jgi:murein DD-endopeptidase MepM/ murein hydrolase activator NlpD
MVCAPNGIRAHPETSPDLGSDRGTPRELIGAKGITGGCAGAVAVAVAIVALIAQRDPTTPLVDVGLAFEAEPRARGANVAWEDAPPQLPWVNDKIPSDRSGRPFDEIYPSLVEWVHPVTAADEHVPWNPARHFGAQRGGISRRDCGRGHCGVDLDGPRGRPIVAVAPGVVVRVERRRSGGDGISGRFVRIRHDDGYFTSYMHLDTVDPKLDLGQRVSAAQYLGTLGSTGVAANAPHLHFSLEFPLRPTKRDDVSYHLMRFRDPVPFLIRATVIEAPVRRQLKPAF